MSNVASCEAKEIETIEICVGRAKREFAELEDYFDIIINQTIRPMVVKNCEKGEAVPPPETKIDKIIADLKSLEKQINSFRTNQLVFLREQLIKI